jgi:hypothetical protein
VAVVGRLVQKWERDSTKGETVHKRYTKHRIHEIENSNTKQKANKMILKNISRIISK